jgi:hypothetical protein
MVPSADWKMDSTAVASCGPSITTWLTLATSLIAFATEEREIDAVPSSEQRMEVTTEEEQGKVFVSRTVS